MDVISEVYVQVHNLKHIELLYVDEHFLYRKDELC